MKKTWQLDKDTRVVATYTKWSVSDGKTVKPVDIQRTFIEHYEQCKDYMKTPYWERIYTVPLSSHERLLGHLVDLLEKHEEPLP